ncbi:MAG: hypothetical protein WAU06_01205, partial [Candidatus Nanopelagicales bacterium]
MESAAGAGPFDDRLPGLPVGGFDDSDSPSVVGFELVVAAAQADQVVGAGGSAVGAGGERLDVVEVAAVGRLAAAGELTPAVAGDDVLAQVCR